MTEHLNRRTPNEKLKAIRLTLNMSQTEFATAVRHAGDALGEPNACSKRLVQKWESGEHIICRPNYRRALQKVAGTRYTELGFTDSINAGSLHASITGLLGSTEDPSRSPVQFGESSDSLRYALARPEVASVERVNLVAESTEYLFGLENHHPARIVLPTVAQHIREIASLLCGTRHKPFRRSLALAGGQSAALAGWLTFDLGDTSAAHGYWDSALACARHAANGPLFACVLTYQSYSAAKQGDHETAWQLAHAAIGHAGDSPRAQAWMVIRAAQEAAQLGDPGAALAELRPVADLLTELDPAAPADEAEPWCRFVDRAYVHAMTANVYGRLGDTESAYSSAIRALDSLSTGQTKTRALILAEAAQAFARIGGTDRATRCITEAIAVADRLESMITLRRIRTLAPEIQTAKS